MSSGSAFQQIWDAYEASGDDARVHRDVRTKLGMDVSAAPVITFLRDLEAFVADEDKLLLLLSIGLCGRFESQMSFLGLLLREDVLQTGIVDMLLEKLSEFAAEMDAQLLERNIPKLILREIRWMGLIVDSMQLLEKLLSALPALPLSLQQDVIYILPEIASDEDSLIVVEALLELIQSEAALVVCCVEALGNFNVLHEQTERVVQCVMERLVSSPLADLPAIVKYLIQEVPGSDIELIADQLCEKLSTTLSFQEPDLTGAEDARSEEALILGILVQGFHFREDLLKVFLVRMQSAEQTQMRLLDVWILFASHSISQHKTKMEKLLKKQFQNGRLSSELLIQSIQSHKNALKTYFPSLIQLATTLISHSANATCIAMGQLLFELLFEEFSMRYGNHMNSNQIAFYQGEIVSALLGHCLSNDTNTSLAAIDTFTSLASPTVSFHELIGERSIYAQKLGARKGRLAMFLPAMKQMLDVMEDCNVVRARKIYDLLFTIGGHNDPDLCNLVRKLSFHQEPRYRCYGIIAAVSRLKILLRFVIECATTDDDKQSSENFVGESEPPQQSDKDIATSFNRSVVDLFESCLSHTTCVSFMLDELTVFVTVLERGKYADILVGIICEYFMDFLSAQFMDDFVLSKKLAGDYEKTVLSGAMKTTLWIGLDDKLSPVYLKILDLVVSPNATERHSLMFLSSLMTLLLTCARKRNVITEIECVLVCPIQMMERSVIEEISGLDTTAQNAVCATIWHAVNWIRSILNFFACEKTDYYVTKVSERLENLLMLESILLDELIPVCLSFSPVGLSSTSESIAHSGHGKLLEAKKVGRPSSKSSPVVAATDRRSFILKSFLPLWPEVISILTSPRILSVVTSAQSSAANGSASTMPIVGFLFHLLRSHVQTCVQGEASKNPTASFRGKRPGDAKSGKYELLVHEMELVTAGPFILNLLESGVLDATGNYARQLLSSATQTQEADEDTSSTVRAETDRVLILMDYFHVLKLIADLQGNSIQDQVDELMKYKCLQAMVLTKDKRVSFNTTDPPAFKQHVLKRCFKVLLRYLGAVEDNLSMGVAHLTSLTSLLSLAYGFDAMQVLHQIPSIALSGRKESIPSVMASQISEIALLYLQKDWSNGDLKYVYKNAQLEVLLKCYLHQSEIILDSIQTLAIDGFLQLLEHDGQRSAAFATLDKKSVGIYHRVMLDALVAATARLDTSAATDVHFLLNYLSQAALLFKLLVCVTKGFQRAALVASVLKLGRKFLEMVLRVMPFFQAQFRQHSEPIMKLIGEVQVATRRMQVLCAHGKLIKDPSVASQVPMVKKLLEKLIYRGEELASANGVLDAYTTGVLKNRRIDGTTIGKEELEGTAEEEESEEDEEPDYSEGYGDK